MQRFQELFYWCFRSEWSFGYWNHRPSSSNLPVFHLRRITHQPALFDVGAPTVWAFLLFNIGADINTPPHTDTDESPQRDGYQLSKVLTQNSTAHAAGYCGELRQDAQNESRVEALHRSWFQKGLKEVIKVYQSYEVEIIFIVSFGVYNLLTSYKDTPVFPVIVKHIPEFIITAYQTIKKKNYFLYL